MLSAYMWGYFCPAYVRRSSVLVPAGLGRYKVVPSMSGWLLVGLEIVPPVVALALPLEVALLVIHLCGVIVDLEEAFEEVCRGRDLERGDLAPNESTKDVGVNFQGKFIYTQTVIGFVRDNYKAMQRQRILRGNPIWEKSRGGGEKFTIFKRLQRICRARLCGRLRL